jgi:hypothetical protein
MFLYIKTTNVKIKSLFFKILRNHIMVRVGGGWDTLENYLNKHDPCRFNSDHHGCAGNC